LEHSYPRPWYSCSVSRCWKTSRHRIWEAFISSVRALRTSHLERTGQYIPKSHPGETGTLETVIPAVPDSEGEDACRRALPPAGPEAPIQHRPGSVRTAAKSSDSTAMGVGAPIRSLGAGVRRTGRPFDMAQGKPFDMAQGEYDGEPQ
jgi:hypothetical protein